MAGDSSEIFEEQSWRLGGAFPSKRYSYGREVLSVIIYVVREDLVDDDGICFGISYYSRGEERRQ